MLDKNELIRYQRQMQLRELGLGGQQKLKQAKVLVVGAGGLGCSVLHYLVASGVGEIGIVDFDMVSVSNLQRQVLYTIEDTGKSKVECAIRYLSKQNEYVELKGFPVELTNKNAIEIFNGYDIIVDGTDNFETRYVINDACVLLGKPLVYGAVYRFEGQVSVFNYTKNMLQGPTYRCLFPEPPTPGAFWGCVDAGVLGVVPGMIGCMQANEVFKIITGIGEVLSGKLVLINTLTMRSDNVLIDRCNLALTAMPASVEEFEVYDYKLFCSNATQTNL
ncbi:MAG: HesA/MoeB/ThiF family protein [Bacteroidia bacterium]